MSKKLIALFSALLMAVSVPTFAVGCGPKADYTVGTVRFANFDALSKADQGFSDKLTQLMENAGKTVNIQVKDANKDMSNCTTISDTFISQNVDLIFAIATPAAQAAANKTKKIPIVFTAVTDAPSAGLVQNPLAPEGNVTGISDINPVRQQLELARDLAATNPDASKRTKIGFFYDNGESNSIFQLAIAESLQTTLGIEIVKEGLVDKANLVTNFNHLADQVGAIYIPTDNTIADGIGGVKTANTDKKIPIVCGEEGPTAVAGIATYSVSYYEMGERCAETAFEILVNGKSISELPVGDMLDQTHFKIYEDNAAAIGYAIPDSVKNRQ